MTKRRQYSPACAKPISAALCVAGTACRRRQRQLPVAARVVESQLRGRGRSPLHQPVGPRFPTGIRQLGRLRQLLPGISVHAYTATATARVRRDIAAQLDLQNPSSWSARSIGRTPLSCPAARDPQAPVARRPRAAPRRSRDRLLHVAAEMDALADWLGEIGVPPCPITPVFGCRSQGQSGCLPQRAGPSRRGHRRFRDGHRPIGRPVRRHTGAPRSLEHYQQESGRAGRDGLEAECLLISSSADFMKWRHMLEQNGELNDGRAVCCD